jgi:hypothetical protein
MAGSIKPWNLLIVQLSADCVSSPKSVDLQTIYSYSLLLEMVALLSYCFTLSLSLLTEREGET